MDRETHVIDQLKVSAQVTSHEYTINIDESIMDPVYYRNVINTLQYATPNDNINMFINSGGGFVSSASAVTYAMDRCEANITAHLVGDVCSAASVIALHAHRWEVGEDVSFMVHTCSFGVYNSAEKVADHHDHVQRQNAKLMRRTYAGFLTDNEIDRCLDGKEFWMGKDEVEERLQNFIQYHQEKTEAEQLEYEREQIEKDNQDLSKSLDYLIEKGKIKPEDKELAVSINKMIDEAIESGDLTESLVEDEITNKLSGIIEQLPDAQEEAEPDEDLLQSMRDGVDKVAGGAVVGVDRHRIKSVNFQYMVLEVSSKGGVYGIYTAKSLAPQIAPNDDSFLENVSLLLGYKSKCKASTLNKKINSLTPWEEEFEYIKED